LSSIVLSQQCRVVYFISLRVAKPLRLDYQILLKSPPPPNVTGWICPCTEVFSLQTQGRVYAASEQQCTLSSGEVQVPRGGIYEWQTEGLARRLIQGLARLMHSSAWALSLCVNKMGVFKHRKAVSF